MFDKGRMIRDLLKNKIPERGAWAKPTPPLSGFLRDLRIYKIPIFEREGWLCQPSLSKIGILFSCKFLNCG